MAFQWLPLPAISIYKLNRLRAVVRHAEQHVPLYREKFRKAGVSARDLLAIDDLRWFPTLTREEVIDAYPDGILSRPPRPADVVFRTSGTSGQFMQIAYSARANDFLDAVYGRALFNAGYRPWDRIAYYWWEPEPKPLTDLRAARLDEKELFADPRRSGKAAGRSRLARPGRRLSLSERALDDRADPGARARPPSLQAAPGDLPRRIHGGRAADLHGTRARNVRFTTSTARRNSTAWAGIAASNAGFHEDSDSVHIEILNGDQPAKRGEEGEVVVTGLANDLMPLIRYRIGDAGNPARERAAAADARCRATR